MHNKYKQIIYYDCEWLGESSDFNKQNSSILPNCVPCLHGSLITRVPIGTNQLQLNMPVFLIPVEEI